MSKDSNKDEYEMTGSIGEVTDKNGQDDVVMKKGKNGNSKGDDCEAESVLYVEE
ncbi:hypothetical protein Tco_1388895, partial [Tanacetum coccineum]